MKRGYQTIPIYRYAQLATKLKIFFKNPAWNPNDQDGDNFEVVSKDFQIYNPPLTALQKWLAVIIFAVAILFSIYFFITVDQHTYFDKIICLAQVKPYDDDLPDHLVGDIGLATYLYL